MVQEALAAITGAADDVGSDMCDCDSPADKGETGEDTSEVGGEVTDKTTSEGIGVNSELARMADAMERLLRQKVDKERGVRELPLLLVLRDTGKRSVYFGGRIFRVCFVCPVCGEVQASGPKGKGYKLVVVGRFGRQLLQATYLSLCLLQVALHVAGLPGQIAALGELAVQTLGVVKEDLVGVLKLDSAEVEALAASVSGATVAPTAATGVGAESREYPISDEHVQAVRALLGELGDARAELSGLHRVLPDHGGCAWVCGGGCKEEYQEKGDSCLSVVAKYD